MHEPARVPLQRAPGHPPEQQRRGVPARAHASAASRGPFYVWHQPAVCKARDMRRTNAHPVGVTTSRYAPSPSRTSNCTGAALGSLPRAIGIAVPTVAKRGGAKDDRRMCTTHAVYQPVGEALEQRERDGTHRAEVIWPHHRPLECKAPPPSARGSARPPAAQLQRRGHRHRLTRTRVCAGGADTRYR